MNSINIKNLGVKRRDFSFFINDLKIDNCNLCLIIGPNGGGKTTLLKSLAGLLNYDGKILFNDTDVSAMDFKARARLFAYLPQNVSVPEFRVKDFLITGRLPYTGFLSSYSKEDWEKVAVVSEQVDVIKYMDRELLSLSQGELQRVILAKVFIQNPKVLLLDEPTNALDIGFKELIKEQVYNYIDTNPESIVFISTHEPEFFKDRPNKTLLLKEGQLFKFGELKNVYDEQSKKELFNLR